MEPSESLEEEESVGEEHVLTVEGDEGGEEHMTSFVSLLENCFQGISEEGGRGRGEDSLEDREENEEESVGVVADDISNPSGETPNTAPSMPFPVEKESAGVGKNAILIASSVQKRLCCSSEISSRNTLR